MNTVRWDGREVNDWQSGNYARYMSLLERQRPGPGEEDQPVGGLFRNHSIYGKLAYDDWLRMALLMWLGCRSGRIMIGNDPGMEVSMKRTDDAPTDNELFETYLRTRGNKYLAEVVRRTHTHVWNVALRITGNEADASDLSQEVFLRLIQNPPAAGTVSSVRGYLSARVVTVDQNRRRSYERRRQRETQAARSELLPGSPRAIENQDALRVALEGVPERQRTVLKLRYFAEMKNSEIAAALGLSIRTVEDNLRKGREALGQKAGAGSLLGAAALTAKAWSYPPAQLLPSLLQIVECGAAIVSGSAAASVSTSTTASKVASFSTVLASRWGVALACSGVAVVLALSYLVPNRPKDRDVAPSAPAMRTVEKPGLSQQPVQPEGPPAPEGLTISGRLLDAFGNPLTKGQVRLLVAGDREAEQKVREQQVPLSSNGTFTFADVVSGHHTLIAKDAVWGEVRKDLGMVQKDLTTDLHYKATSEITGEIYGVRAPHDDEERFLRMAKIRIDGPIADLGQLTAFDKCPPVTVGAFCFQVGELGPGLYRLLGNLSAGTIFEEFVEIEKNGERIELVLDLKKRVPRVFRGRAFIGDRSRPLEDTLLSAKVWSHGASMTLSSRGLRTDAEGYFSCESPRLVTGSLIRLERSKDLPSVAVEYVSLPEADDEYEVIFPEPTSRKAIVRTRDGKPIPNVEVSLQRWVPPPRSQWKTTDLKGEFDISSVDLGPCRVRLRVANGSLPLVGVDRSHRYPGYRLEIDDSGEDLVIEADPGRFLALGIEGLAGRAQNNTLFKTIRMPDGSRAPALAMYRKQGVSILNGSLIARVTIDEGRALPKVSFHTPTQGRHTQYRGQGLAPGAQFPLFTLINIPDRASISIELLGAHIGWGTARVSAAELDASPHVGIRLGQAPQETEVQVIDAAGRPVVDARFEVPGFTAYFRKGTVRAGLSLEGPSGSRITAEEADRINPIIGTVPAQGEKEGGEEAPSFSPRLVSGPGRYRLMAYGGNWEVPSSSPPRVSSVGPGRYRLLVYGCDDFPIRVSSPTAGTRLVYGSTLIADPVVVME